MSRAVSKHIQLPITGNLTGNETGGNDDDSMSHLQLHKHGECFYTTVTAAAAGMKQQLLLSLVPFLAWHSSSYLVITAALS